ncbi:hypothetical protein S83_030628 [Arachis hypogaea]
MTLKNSQLLHILIWLSLIFLLFHHYCNLNKKQIIEPTNPKNHHGRKVLLATKFDFSPFFNHHHRHKHPPPDPSDTQIDPRYGVQKRRVPTGPNPLHH